MGVVSCSAVDSGPCPVTPVAAVKQKWLYAVGRRRHWCLSARARKVGRYWGAGVCIKSEG